MLRVTQRNQLFEELMRLGMHPMDFEESNGSTWYRLTVKNSRKLQFNVTQNDAQAEGDYTISRLPGYDSTVDKEAISQDDGWGNGSYGIWPSFTRWAAAAKRELNTPDLWAESTQALQLFAPTEAPAADRFTTAELGAVQGQLRMLGQGFLASELSEVAKQKLVGICQTAMLKADTFTKRDWQNWIAGAFANAVVALELDEAQQQEILALIRLAFGGLFLQS